MSARVGSWFAWMACVLSVCVLANVSTAHPFGPSSVNRYMGFTLNAEGGIRVAWVMDLAEMPSMLELDKLDPDHDGAVTPQEQDQWLNRFVPEWTAQWELTLDGERVVPVMVARRVETTEGQNGIPTLRVLAELRLDPPTRTRDAAEHTLHVRDASLGARDGWREIRADDVPEGTVITRNVIDLAPVVDPRLPGVQRIARMDEATFTFRRAVTSTLAKPQVPLPTHRSRVWLWGALFVVATMVCLIGLGARGWRSFSSATQLLIALSVSVSSATMPLQDWRWVVLHAIFVCGLVLHAWPQQRVRWWVVRFGVACAWAVALLGLKVLLGARLATSWTYATRVFLAVMALVVFASSRAPWALSSALASLRFPSVVVETVTATLRGLWLLQDEAQRLTRARLLRAPRATLSTRLGMFGSYAASVLERGAERAKRMEMVAQTRGFSHRALRSSKVWSVRSAGMLCLVIVTLVTARVSHYFH